MPEIAYAVIETHTKIVLFFAPSRLTATALAMGMLNTAAVEFVVHENFLSDCIKTVDRDQDIVWLKQAHGYPVRVKVLPDYPDKQKVLCKREILKIRSQFLYALELLCETQLTRTAGLIDPAVLPFLQQQLHECRPDDDFYTPAIQEYADINEISVDVAYQELLIRTQSADLIRLRVQAFYDKYSRMLTSLSTVEECDQLMIDLRHNLYLHAYI